MKPSVKPLALRTGSRIKVVSPAAPADEVRLYRGCQELAALGYSVQGQTKEVRGIILGELPECEPTERGDVTVRNVLERIIGGKEIPVVSGAPVGHTQRPMLTLPLGVRARLHSIGAGRLEILEPACTEPSPSA